MKIMNKKRIEGVVTNSHEIFANKRKYTNVIIMKVELIHMLLYGYYEPIMANGY